MRPASLLSKRLAGVRSFSSAAGKPSFIQQALFDAPSQSALNEEFPGIPALSGKAAPVSQPKVIKLPNGVTVVSQDKNGGVASIGVFVKAGSRFESVPGTSHLLEQVAFRSTQKRSAAKIQRDVEDYGAVVAAKAGRETFSYSAEVLRDGTEELVEILSDVVTAPKLIRYDIDEQKEGQFAAIVNDYSSNSVVALVESVHAAAFGNTSPLGHGLYASPAKVEELSNKELRDLLGKSVVGSNIVVAGVNVDENFADIASKYFGTVPSGNGPVTDKPTYVGGEKLVNAPLAKTAQVAIAFPAPGLNNIKGVHTMGVWQALVGSTEEAASQSRIGLASAAEVESAAAFAFPYSDIGLIGITVSGKDANTAGLLAATAKFAKGSTVEASAAELERAKNIYKLKYLSRVESRAGAAEEFGVSALLTGKVPSVEETLKVIDSITAADVAALAKSSISAAPSVSVIGTLASVPKYETVVSYLK